MVFPNKTSKVLIPYEISIKHGSYFFFHMPKFWDVTRSGRCNSHFCTSLINRRGILLQLVTPNILSPPLKQELHLRRSLSLANQIPQDLVDWERSPRSTIISKWFAFPQLILRGSCLVQKRSPQSFLRVKALWFSCWEPPIELWSCAPTYV
jgi:hypothetical protein